MGRAKVLVVDDDPAIRQLLAATLAGNGFEPILCEDPQRAVERARSSGVEAVVLDLMMPGMSGFEVLDQLRRDPLVAHIPVLILSAKSAGSDRVEGLRAGADDYLAKPFDPAELVIRIGRLVSGHGRERDVILSGELGGLSAGDILQQVLASGIDGVLHVGGAPPGAVVVHEGQIRAVRCGELEGESALLVLLERRSGRFRFLRSDVGSNQPEDEAIGLQGALMQLAWLEDELERNRQHLPPPGAPLHPARPDEEPEESECSAIGTVLAWFRDHPGSSLADLESAALLAPAEARLAVAILCRDGFLEALNTAEEESPAPDISESIEALCVRLEARAVVLGKAPGVVHLLLAVAPERWEGFVGEFTATFPSELLGRPTEHVVEELRGNGSASLRISCTDRTLLLHAHRLGGLSGLRAKAFLSLASFIVLVPSGAPSREEIEFIDALEKSAGSGERSLVVVPPDEGRGEGLRIPSGARIADRIPATLEELLEVVLG